MAARDPRPGSPRYGDDDALVTVLATAAGLCAAPEALRELDEVVERE